MYVDVSKEVAVTTTVRMRNQEQLVMSQRVGTAEAQHRKGVH
jgi:hypothetical protein